LFELAWVVDEQNNYKKGEITQGFILKRNENVWMICQVTEGILMNF